MLMHNRNACSLRIMGRPEADRLPVHQNAPLAWRMNPSQQLHASAFARPIFAQQGKNFAPPQLKRGVSQGDCATKNLCDVRQSKGRGQVRTVLPGWSSTLIHLRATSSKTLLLFQFAIRNNFKKQTPN
jgi:hypothetical protein